MEGKKLELRHNQLADWFIIYQSIQSDFIHSLSKLFESERTRARLLLALTRQHSALEFENNDYVQQIMDDYATSRNLEIQQRANDYYLLRSHNGN